MTLAPTNSVQVVPAATAVATVGGSLPPNYYLTQAILKWGQAQACGLTDTYSFHGALYNCFPQPAAERFLFRIEGQERLDVLIISQRKPQPLIWGLWQTQVVGLGKLTPGQHFRFKLQGVTESRTSNRLGNPERKRDHAVIPLLTEEAQLAWLDRKGLEHGYKVVGAQTTRSGWQYCPSKGPHVRHYVTDFTGYLTCTDAALLDQAVLGGIGRGKAFGCGLLALLPV